MSGRDARVAGERATGRLFLLLLASAAAVMGCGSAVPPGGPSASGTGGAPKTDGAGTGGTLGSAGAGAGGAGTGTGGQSAGTGGMQSGDAGGTTGAGGSRSGTGGTTAVSSALALVPVPFWPNGAIATGVRGVTSPAVAEMLELRNNGTMPITVTALTLAGANAAAFHLGGPTVPVVLAPGATMPVTVEALTTGSALPPAPAQNSGGTLLAGTLTASTATGSASANLFALLLTTATHEVTLGQILVTLGFKLNVGLAQNNANPNTGTVQQLPRIEAGTDEIAAPLFRKLGSGKATLRAVARFSPKGPMPYGWYPAGMPATRNLVATMASMPDPQTSDKARMVLPPITGSVEFDPGTASFGVWVYTDQLSQKYDTGGTATNGDYNYSEDAPNSPANVHRTKVYPLKDAAGAAVPDSFLLAVEEAGNGDYQDYVFVLSNVAPAN